MKRVSVRRACWACLEQVQQNAEAVFWAPSEKDLEELDRIFPQTPKVALFWAFPSRGAADVVPDSIRDRIEATTNVETSR